MQQRRIHKQKGREREEKINRREKRKKLRLSEGEKNIDQGALQDEAKAAGKSSSQEQGGQCIMHRFIGSEVLREVCLECVAAKELMLYARWLHC